MSASFMTKDQLTTYIANEVQNINAYEQEEMKRELMKMNAKCIRWLAEHIEDNSKVGV